MKEALARVEESPPTAPAGESVPRFPIVGIGASAGGLAALEKFFSGLPADRDIGMAFVVVQHLAPDHKSILGDIVRRYARLDVHEVEDGMEVRPNHVYIIPPNADMSLEDGRLRLRRPVEPRGQRLPIDYFFRSLASVQHEHAICVVLSGTGSDGTLGARAVKGEGGMVVVQEPSTIKTEIEFAKMDRDITDMGKLGPLSPFTCPSCRGALWDLQDGEDILRYRCHTGHAFSKDSLLGEQTTAIEDALYSALRAVEEKATARRRLSERHAGRSEPLRQEFQQKAEGLDETANVLRSMLAGEAA